jgi:hypothetical protein
LQPSGKWRHIGFVLDVPDLPGGIPAGPQLFGVIFLREWYLQVCSHFISMEMLGEMGV